MDDQQTNALHKAEKSTYRRLKAGRENLMPQYNKLDRTVKRLTKKAKSNYEIKISSQAKTNPKVFFQVYKKNMREELGSLKTANGELVRWGGGSKILNEYFLTVFILENMQDIPNTEQIFRAEQSEKLADTPIAKEMVEKKQIDKNNNNKKIMSAGSNPICLTVLKESTEIVSGP